MSDPEEWPVQVDQLDIQCELARRQVRASFTRMTLEVEARAIEFGRQVEAMVAQ